MRRGTAELLGVLLLAGGQPALAPRLQAQPTTAKPTSEATRPPVSASAQSLLREQFRYDPSAQQSGTHATAPEPGVVEMEPFVISESRTDRALDHALAQRQAKDQAQQPSLANGVSVPGVPSLGVKPYKDVMPFGAPMARVSIFKLDW